MKLKLFLFIILVIVAVGCSPKATLTQPPVLDTPLPPTSTPVPPTASRTPFPSMTAIPSPTEIVPGVVLFEDDFEDGKADNFVYISNGWIVTAEDNGNKVFEINTNTELAIKNDVGAGAGFGSEDWTNYSAEYRVKMLNGRANTWLSFRSPVGGGGAYYVEWLSAEYDSFNLFYSKPQDDWQNIKSLGFSVWDERWYQVKVEAQGSILRMYLDDTLMMEVEDTHITRGGFNMGVFPGTHALFDDVRVIALGDSP